ncbi:MAG TPA: FAD:protein FMN transferase [Bradyrhizobium sp.]|uniref:FAD:protein FMN transferase n=1 Tax=Bradyrhizobium sp. TaxID=376 RepID=UPI002D7FF35B|nr:FAD:protein FMN transferase [Bradyrhizobium sp.]HET7889477.1 FAD:protein FMN transferase [Bradyrhizobium sp.]
MAAVSNKVRRAKPLLGTFVEIEAAGPSQAELGRAIDAAFEQVAMVHRLMSFHDPDSDVGRLNRDAADRPVRVHAWTFQVLKTSIELHRRSGGIFNVAVAPALQAMGLLPQHDADAIAQTPPPPVHEAIELVDGQMVRFRDRQARIDLGGIAKGFAVDRALDSLRQAGSLAWGLVNAGGDLAACGAELQSAYIRHPRDPGRVVCRVDFADEALASTARRFDLFRSSETAVSAIIDPHGQTPANSIDGVTVRASSCMIADALTKIVMISGPAAGALLEQCNASALLVTADGELQISPDWQNAVHLAA